MSVRLLPIVLHSVAASIMIWGYNQLSTLGNYELITKQVGGYFQYLTIQGLTAACITMVLGLSADLFPVIQGVRKAQRALMMVSLPISVVISLIYWSLIIVSPSLILPAAPNAEPSSSSATPALMWVPLKNDLALHASPALALLIDFMAYHESYTPREVNYGGTILAILAGTWYATWVEYCASYNKIFPYPFLTENPLNIRVGIYAGAVALALISFRVINSLHPGRRPIK